MKTITKPWGREEWLELNDRYCYKRIYINAGHKTSFQYHINKKETTYIISGTAEIWLENDAGVVEKKIMNPGDYFNVIPPKKHRVCAITDLITQEVSTPEVDDVIRIEDDTNRKNGRVESEHSNLAVLILSAGKGTRLKTNTSDKNKALIPINNKAIISHIIEKFPNNVDIIITVGYKSESLIDYCKFAHPRRNITFVEVNGWENSSVGPGHSALQCKKYLQRPFYVTTADCIIDNCIPELKNNWLGIHPTGIPEKYATVTLDTSDNITSIVDKSKTGHDHAFIGLAGVVDYDIFWSELERNNSTELISAWINPSKYKTLIGTKLKWIDTGTLDDLENALEYFNDVPMSLNKNTCEITYKIGCNFLKLNATSDITNNRFSRGTILGSLAPKNLEKSGRFLRYDWVDGLTLYKYNSFSYYMKFLTFLDQTIKSSEMSKNEDASFKFYNDKSKARLQMALPMHPVSYFKEKLKINGVTHRSMEEIFSNIKFDSFRNSDLYSKFHGDLHFDNIVYNSVEDIFTYIDWRESYCGEINAGDIYYDLAKLYGGCIISYDAMKNDSTIHIDGYENNVTYSHFTQLPLNNFRIEYEKWIIKNGYSLDKIKLITGLIYLNMSPLHTENFSKLLWYKSIELLDVY